MSSMAIIGTSRVKYNEISVFSDFSPLHFACFQSFRLFLIRDSSKLPGHFVLSIMNLGRMQNFQIQHVSSIKKVLCHVCCMATDRLAQSIKKFMKSIWYSSSSPFFSPSR